MENQKGGALLIIIIILVIILIGGGVAYYYYTTKAQPKPVACTQEAKICPDGSSVGRSGPNCDFAPCPDPTIGWNNINNAEFGFSLKYPNNFFDAGHKPKILIGDCNYNVFPDSCPNINNIVIDDLVAAGGDINAIKSNLSYPNYWKNPSGEKQVINNVNYCIYSNSDAAMGHVYNYYYYATVKNQKCVVVSFDTSSANCNFYLPLEPGNTEQATNYNNCLTTNKNQPTILNEIINTFNFTK
jgi:hypothetical protein